MILVGIGSSRAKCEAKRLNIGLTSIHLSSSFENRLIKVPLHTVITSVPQLIPTNFLKNASVIVVPRTSIKASKQVLKTAVFMQYFLLMPIKNKSYTSGYRYVFENKAIENADIGTPRINITILTQRSMLPGGVTAGLKIGISLKRSSTAP